MIERYLSNVWPHGSPLYTTTLTSTLSFSLLNMRYLLPTVIVFHHLNYCVPGRRFVRNAICLSSSADSAPLSRCLIFWQLLDTFCEPQQTDNFKQTDNQVQMLFIEILSLVSYRRIQHFSASRSVKKPKTWIKCGISMCVFHKGIGVVGQPHSKLHLI